MSIEVTCSNGHSMRVKNEFAGKSGLCPYCQARIAVPEMSIPKSASASISEDDLLAVLKPPWPAAGAAVAEARPAQTALPQPTVAKVPQPHWRQDQTTKNAAADPLSAEFVHRRRVCPKCCEIVPLFQQGSVHAAGRRSQDGRSHCRSNPARRKAARRCATTWGCASRAT